MSCRNSPHITSESFVRTWLKSNDVINQDLEITNKKAFDNTAKELTYTAYEKYGVQGKLIYAQDNKAQFNTHLFHYIDAIKGVWYQENAHFLGKIPEEFTKNKDGNSNINPSIKKITPLLNNLRNRSGISYEFVTMEQANDLLQEDVSNTDRTAFILNGKIYFIAERFDSEDAAHEYAHIFVRVLKEENPKLYDSIVKQIKESKEGQQWLEWSYKNNPHYSSTDHYEEVMAKMIGLASKAKLENKGSSFRGMLEAIEKFLSKLFGFNVSLNTTMSELSAQMLSAETKWEVNGIVLNMPNVLYNTRMSPIFDKLVKESDDIKLTDDESHYELKGKTFKRLTDFIRTVSGKGIAYSNKIEIEAQERADKLWEGKDEKEELSVPGVANDGKFSTLNKADYMETFIKQRKQGARKGNIFHYSLDIFIKNLTEDTAKLVELYAKLAVEKAASMYEYDWIKDDLFETLFKKLNIVSGKTYPLLLHDKLASEVKVVSEIMELGTAADLLIEHFDKRFSMIDWKTTSSLDLQLRGWIFNTYDIPNTPRNQAKIELLLRALVFKVENPLMKFRKLALKHVFSSGSTNFEDFDGEVDVDLLLPILEKYYKKEKPEIYAKMIAQSKDAFNKSHYYSISQRTSLAYAEWAASHNNGSKSTYLAYLKAALVEAKNNYDYALNKGFANATGNDAMAFHPKLRTRIRELSALVLDLSRYDTMENIEGNKHDISSISAFFGQAGDINSAEIQALKVLEMEVSKNFNHEKADLMDRFHTYANALLKEYLGESAWKNLLSKATAGYINFANYNEMFSPLFKMNNRDQPMVITQNDAEWKSLTQAQKNFLTFTRVNMQNLSDEVLNKEFSATTNTKMTIFEALIQPEHSEFSSTVEKIVDPKTQKVTYKLADGFYGKIPITDHEFTTLYGTFSPAHRARIKNQLKNSVFKSAHTMTMDLGMPVRFLTSTSEHSSKNLALAFESFMTSLLEKKHKDILLATGLGLLDTVETRLDKRAPTDLAQQANLATYLRNRINLDLLKLNDKTNVTEQDYQLDVNKVEKHIRGLVSTVIMALKPVHGFISGGIVPFFISARHSLASGLAGTFAGVKKDGLDFTPADMAWAIKEWADLEAAGAMGNARKHKAWLIAKHTNYLTDDFSYTLNEDDGAILRNPGLSSKYKFIFHTFWENANTMIIMLAQLKHMQVQTKTMVNGKEVITEKSMYDSYEVVDKYDDLGNAYSGLKWKGGVRGLVTKQGETTELTELSGEEISRLKRVYQKMQGAYRQEEKMVAEAYLLGRVALQFRKYLPTMLIGAFGSKHQDITYGEYEKVGEENGIDVYEWKARIIEGRYRVLARFLYDVATFKGGAWEDLTDLEKVEMMEAIVSLTIFIVGGIASSALFGDGDDDDEAQKAYKRILENIIQQYNFIDWFRNLKTMPATINKAWDFSIGVTTLFLANPYNALLDKDIYTNEGNLKGMVQTVKGIPVLSAIYATLKFFETNTLTGDKQWFADYMDSFVGAK